MISNSESPTDQEFAEPYRDSLRRLSETRNPIAASLIQAERNRTVRLALYADGHRLRGISAGHEILVTALNSCPESLNATRYLINRALLGLQCACDGLLSGYQTVVADTMRDTMETSLLLRHFAHFPATELEWWTASESDRRRKFPPVKLREAEAFRQGVPVHALSDSVDYKAHSQYLHVTPIASSIVIHRGVSTDETGLNAEVSFWEIFLHLGQLIEALSDLFDNVVGTTLQECCNPTAWAQFAYSCEIVSLTRWCVETTLGVATGDDDWSTAVTPDTAAVAMQNASTYRQVLDQMREQLDWKLDHRTWTIFFEAMAKTAAPMETVPAETAAERFVRLVSGRPR